MIQIRFTDTSTSHLFAAYNYRALIFSMMFNIRNNIWAVFVTLKDLDLWLLSLIYILYVMCDLYMSYLATPEHPELQLNKVSKVLSLNTKYL